MSLIQWFVCASFASGIITLSLQPTGIANATLSPIVLVADQLSGNSEDGQRDSPSATIESSRKMKSKDPFNDVDPNSKMDTRPNKSSGARQGKQPRALRGKKGTSDAESIGKMKNNDPLNDMDPTSKMDSRPNH
jgi:hypothetical protein